MSIAILEEPEALGFVPRADLPEATLPVPDGCALRAISTTSATTAKVAVATDANAGAAVAVPVSASSTVAAVDPLDARPSRDAVATAALDALAASLAGRLQELARPLCRAAEAFVRREGWFELGFARAEDFARERLGRSGRWLRDLAALGAATLDSEELLAALTGRDGGPALGSVAALAIARGTTGEFRSDWIALARALGVRELKRRLRQSRAAQVPFPVDDAGARDDSWRPPEARLVGLAPAGPEALLAPVLAGLAAAPGGVGPRLHAPPGPDDGAPAAILRLELPAPIVAAFHETRWLHGRASGRRGSIAEFVEALVGEARAAGFAPRPDPALALDWRVRSPFQDDLEREARWDARRRGGTPDGAPGGRTDARGAPEGGADDCAAPGGGADACAAPLGRPLGASVTAPAGGPLGACFSSAPASASGAPSSASSDAPASACSPPDPPSLRDALAAADALLAHAASLFAAAGTGEAAPLAAQLRALVDLEQPLRRALGALLAELGRRRGWRTLGYASLRHYAEARLGLSRSSAEDLATLSRALATLPVVDGAHASGRISSLAALRIVRILRHAGPSPELESAWVAHAAGLTIKRLDDERDALRCRQLTADDAGDPAPLSDAAWHASLHRAPAETTARLERWARRAAERTDAVATLRLVLPFDLAADFLGALDAAARHVRTFSPGLNGFDARWLGLYTLLTSFVSAHDSAREPRGVYARDGWRCMAPGCTSCAQLEEHHVVYRARGGDDLPGNRVTLCRFHHQRGEHGGRMRVRGRAPLALVFELDGRGYRNERRV